jgi:hypothetical protein
VAFLRALLAEGGTSDSPRARYRCSSGSVAGMAIEGSGTKGSGHRSLGGHFSGVVGIENPGEVRISRPIALLGKVATDVSQISAGASGINGSGGHLLAHHFSL